MFTVGSVPYVNAIPLVAHLDGTDRPVRVLYDVPSNLPPLLANGEAQAILVSSVDSLRMPGRKIAGGVCIGSDGPVKSVRLFSKVPPSEIRRLALDASSMTSNRLAQIVLAEAYGVRPSLTTCLPDLSKMLSDADACVLIGDIGMSADGSGLTVLDLGQEWKELTGLPFVWAAWIGSEGLTPELAGLLAAAEHTDLEALVEPTSKKSGWDERTVRDYFFNVMRYRMDDRMLEGLHEFQRRLLTNGFADACHFPEIVQPDSNS